MSQESPVVEWNELILVSRYQGRIDVWVGWKRAIEAFADPGMWETTERWDECFTRQPQGTPYGMDGYGLIVMDLDTKKGWSMNDFSHPGSIYLPQDYQLDDDDESRARASFAKLLSRPDQWPMVSLTVMREPTVAGALAISKGGDFKQQVLTLDQVISEDASVEENQRSLVSSRGTTKLLGQQHIVFQVKYCPEDWSLLTTLGRSDIEVLDECLAHLHQNGFPPPAYDLIMSKVEDEAADQYEEEDGVAMVERFKDLLSNWPVAPSKPSVPSPR